MLKKRFFMPGVILLFIGGAAAISWGILHTTREAAKSTFGRELQSIAVGTSNLIDAREYYSLFFTARGELKPANEITSDIRFEKFQKLLRMVRKSYKDLNLSHDNIYTFTVSETGMSAQIAWGVMTHNKPFTTEVYEAPSFLKQAIAKAEPGFSDLYFSKVSNREWISGFAPIIMNNQVIGIVEVARDIDEIIAAARNRLILPIIIILIVFILSGVAIFSVFFFSRRLEQRNAALQTAMNNLSVSENLYRATFNSGSEILFTLDNDLNVISINKAIRSQLGMRPEDMQGKNFVNTLFSMTESETQETRNDASLFDHQFLLQNLISLERPGQKFDLTIPVKSVITGESKEFKFIIEKIEGTGDLCYLGRGIPLNDSLLTPALKKNKSIYRLQNSFLQTEQLATHLATMARSFLPEKSASILRIILREMLINAVEHGNLGITFDEKTEAMIQDRYFSLLEERRDSEPWASRHVTVETLIGPEKLAFRITDEGQGFDHKAMLAKLQDGTNETQHGRGIVMTLAEFDKVIYNDVGNSVTLIKYLVAD